MSPKTIYHAADGEYVRKNGKGKHKAQGPDEILAEMSNHQVEIPLLTRDQFPESLALPDSELLQGLHYYFSSEAQNLEDEAASKKVYGAFDESALLTLGMVLEGWIDEAVEESWRMYVVKKEDKGVPAQFNSDDEEYEEYVKFQTGATRDRQKRALTKRESADHGSESESEPDSDEEQ